MGFGNRGNNNNNNNGQGRPQGKEDEPNKVRFSSVKMGETKQRSPTVALYLKRDQAEKLLNIVSEMLEAGEDGCKLNCIFIEGKDYDSGYAYVNPKSPKQEDGNGQGQRQGGFKGRGNNRGGYSGGKQNAREYLQQKRVDDDKEETEGNK
jgi:hypothetical protein